MVMKKWRRHAGPIALAIGLTSGFLAAGTAGASTANGKAHHVHHANHANGQGAGTKTNHHKKNK